jgi:hypothetical protein
MMQYIAMLWTEKKGKLLQTFGPYPTEKAAWDATERLNDWPAIRDGQWDVVALYSNPKQPVQQTSATQVWTGGSITLSGAIVSQPVGQWTLRSDQYMPYASVSVAVPVANAAITVNRPMY